MNKKKILMCRPDSYSVDYVINPWMKSNVGKTDKAKADNQWNDLYSIVAKLADIDFIEPMHGLPDMVFTANAGFTLENDVLLSNFAYKERQPEEPLFKCWFASNGFVVHELPKNLLYEGGGDSLLDSDGRLWAGYGQRTSLETHPYLAKIFKLEVVSLRLMDQRFYHLDTCFCPLESGYFLYYPGAFDSRSNRVIEEKVLDEKLIAVSEEDAVEFACNGVNIDDHIIMNSCSKDLCVRLESVGFDVIQTGLSEFIKAGGSAKCLTLNLSEIPPSNREPLSTVVSGTVVTKGQLIDTSLMSRICDRIVDGGASFQVNGISISQKRKEPSMAEIDISAPSEVMFNDVVKEVAVLGAEPLQTESDDATLAVVENAGVAPDGFYTTTIYSTQVRVDGRWIDVSRQRMDGVIIIEEGKARCDILRNLKAGDKVVTGEQGIKVTTPLREYGYHEMFGFMTASASSERRVDITIESVARDIHRLKEIHGKLVVVAGPVAIHTGGASHIAWMIKHGYISALLGGNGVATHDIERAIYGTSLGVNLYTGKPAHEGHRNHLEAINIIRKEGSIANAVKSGRLSSGIFYELIKNDVPYSLAGSIRDDGPLPDTEMDLLKAQDQYSELIQGADMILALSSMLHAIGTGNMTSANAKFVCVDINPAVVTKLTDRGSLESTGIVTDVGLFLSKLTDLLKSY